MDQGRVCHMQSLMLELGTSSLNTLPSTGSLKCWNKTYGGAKQHEARGQIIRDVILRVMR
ncbi:hypothetical protein DPMN_185053 [Dreissena polymorpha]|uniref:Uncharacterized protein n=1 Tax=Dreissena polymorpha TaxID=45954 RepID=A0A9D4DIZ7_DREPO|nr:hypothetical protein DPMN_185053 [Dreissena polymorpha]